MTDFQTMFYTSSSGYCTVFEASLYHDDHSYSSAMSTTGIGGTAAVGYNASTRSPRRSAQNANNQHQQNGAECNDESDRSASSSATTAALTNGSALSTDSTVSTNNNNGFACTTAGKYAIPTSNNSFDRGNSIQELKKSLTLDFTNPESAKKSLQTQTPELLSFLRLTSPELQKFLTQGFTQGVSVVQTPTPTQFFFPKNVTAEQEQYARGFLDALNQIYQRSGFIPVNTILSPGFVANTVAQEAKEETSKEHTGPTTTSSTSVFPGQSASSVSFNAALVSNFLAAISTPTLPNNGISEPAFITTVSTSGAEQLRQTLAAAAVAASQPQHSTAIYAFNPRSVGFPTSISSSTGVLPNIPSSSTSIAHPASSITTNTTILKTEPEERCTPSPTTYESRSSSVASSYRGEQHSNYSAVSDAAAAAALATMNRGGGHHYGNFHTGGAGASFMQPNPPHQLLALSSAAQLLMGGGSSGHGQQFDHHNLSSTASASSTASSVSSASTKMEICDEQTVPSRYLPGAMPLDPQQQERLKLERKRARNRQAATKCRKRKIERIQTLEQEKAQIEEFNRNLEDTRDVLLNDVQELRKLIEEHQRAKCSIVAPPQPSSSSSNLHFGTGLVSGAK